MKHTSWTLKAVMLALLFTAMVLPASSSAQVVIFDENYDAFNVALVLGDGSTYGADIVLPVTPFNDGNALRMYDFSAVAKPELQGELASKLFEGFEVDFQSLDQGSSTNEDPAIRFRMANSGKSVTSSSRSAFSLSWSADGSFTASFDTGTGSVSSIRSAPLVGVRAVTMVANGTTNLTYSYTKFATARTLDPLSYDVFIDGVLFNDTNTFSGIPDTGLLFSDVDEYSPGAGIQRFGLLGSSSSDTDPDVMFDNIILTSFAIDPSPQLITAEDLTQANGLSFLSAIGTTYVLQSSTNATAEFPTWTDTGMEVRGDGTDQVLFDPAGYSTGMTYRVIEAE